MMSKTFKCKAFSLRKVLGCLIFVLREKVIDYQQKTTDSSLELGAKLMSNGIFFRVKESNM